MKTRIAAAALLAAMTACSASKFSAQKSTVLRNSSVFGAQNSAEHGGNDGTGGGVDQGSDEIIPVQYMCSTAMGTMGNLATATSLHMSITETSAAGGSLEPACTYSGLDIRTEILKNHGFSKSYLRSKCPNLPASGVIQISSGIGMIFYGATNVPGVPGNIGEPLKRHDHGYVVLDLNPHQLDVGQSMTVDPALCEAHASPLIVKLQPPDAPAPLNLSPQARGILFDILGAFADPAPHTPKQISWFTNDDYALIALPDASGEVRGIDQLFGDNTTGPDGRRSANGYHALAKHDGNRDGFITAEDAVFARLRLWVDKNRDGRSDAGETTSLEQQRITSIDLNYDGSYLERDEHGNEVRMKSVAGVKGGGLLLIFDLWFAYRN